MAFSLDSVFEGQNQAKARATKLRGGGNLTRITTRKAKSGLEHLVWWK